MTTINNAGELMPAHSNTAPPPVVDGKERRPEWALVSLVRDAPKGDPESDDPLRRPGGDLHLLDFQAWFPHKLDALKRAVIREVFGFSSVRYYQRLRHIVVSPHGLAHDPQTCRFVQERTARSRAVREGDR